MSVSSNTLHLVFLSFLGQGLAQLPTETQPPVPVQLSQTSPLTGVPEWSQLAQWDGVMTQEEFIEAWKTFYADGKPFPPPWQITGERLEVVTGGQLTSTQFVQFRKSGEPGVQPKRWWRRAEELPALADRPPLSDLHIALDPGHIGGAYSQMEERHLTFNPANPQEVVKEGDLTLLTAKVLKPMLEAAGARVSLVREHLDAATPQRPADFRSTALTELAQAGIMNPVESYAGLPRDAKALTLQWRTERLFYRVAEIRARADKVNTQLRPDIVICLHFNAEDWGDAQQPQYSPLNHLHILINGCYSAPELQLADVRYEALARLFSRLHEVELPLAEAVARAMAEHTKLPPYVYMTSNARNVGSTPYVYARNLLANRLYQCPTIYLEPYVMNHQDTYRRLLRGHYKGRTLADGKLQRSIIEEYSQSVANGLVDFYSKRRR
jgi:N-acetylmuramoyl-L-alanine amidase